MEGVDMDVRKVRATGASLVAVALTGLVASPALASTGVTVSTVSSLEGTSGTLTGAVFNDTKHTVKAAVTVRLMRRGTRAPVIGRAAVRVGAKATARYRAAVELPAGL